MSKYILSKKRLPYYSNDTGEKEEEKESSSINMPGAKRDARYPHPVDLTVQKHKSTVPMPKRASGNRAAKSD